MNILKTKKQLTAKINRLEADLSESLIERMRLKNELEQKKLYSSIREAILTAFNEMAANGASELLVESAYREIHKIHIKRMS